MKKLSELLQNRKLSKANSSRALLIEEMLERYNKGTTKKYQLSPKRFAIRLSVYKDISMLREVHSYCKQSQNYGKTLNWYLKKT